jgi:AP-3 complex subunit sigma
LINRYDTVNTSGVARLTKFYTPLHRASGAGTPQALVHKIFTLVSRRAPGLCNFLDAPELAAELNTGDASTDADGPLRVVYRNYATLYFVFVVDAAESELGVLDLIQVGCSMKIRSIFTDPHPQVFVESLDRSFENVCELDLVFHFDEVHHILAEVIQGGLVLETSVDEIDSQG